MIGRVFIAMLVSVLLPFSVYAKNSSPKISGVKVLYDLDSIMVEGENFSEDTPLLVRLSASGSPGDINASNIGADCSRVDDSHITCDFFPEKLPPTGDYHMVVSSKDKQSRVFAVTIGADCDMDTDQASYTIGETLTISVFSVSNPLSGPAPIEWKGFLEIPPYDPIGFINFGADGALVLPAGFVTDFGPIPLLVVDAGIPAGTYTLGCRVLDPVTGALINEDLHTFDVVH